MVEMFATRSVGSWLVVVFCVGLKRSFVRALCFVSQRSLPESKSFDSVTLLPITI